jgi:hypothetical protein
MTIPLSSVRPGSVADAVHLSADGAPGAVVVVMCDNDVVPVPIRDIGLPHH